MKWKESALTIAIALIGQGILIGLLIAISNRERGVSPVTSVKAGLAIACLLIALDSIALWLRTGKQGLLHFALWVAVPGAARSVQLGLGRLPVETLTVQELVFVPIVFFIFLGLIFELAYFLCRKSASVDSSSNGQNEKSRTVG